MKAAFIEQFGGPEVLKYGDLPDPVAATGEVVVDVVAASVNGADWKVRSGQYSQAAFPLVLGRDFSGLVAATGPGIDDLKVGDAVFGVLEAGREGAYAEKLAIKAAIVAKKPDRLSHVNAVALALTGLTAISASFADKEFSSHPCRARCWARQGDSWKSAAPTSNRDQTGSFQSPQRTQLRRAVDAEKGGVRRRVSPRPARRRGEGKGANPALRFNGHIMPSPSPKALFFLFDAIFAGTATKRNQWLSLVGLLAAVATVVGDTLETMSIEGPARLRWP